MTEAEQLKESADLIRSHMTRKIGVILFVITLVKKDQHSFFHTREQMNQHVVDMEEDFQKLMFSVTSYNKISLDSVSENYARYHQLISKYFSLLSVLRDYFKDRYTCILEYN